ncbi:MAG: ABC transporter permease [Lachnospiraceae bacterium]|jgi:ABC-2 type transport system permease protein|nr:ABC transporter permease [Lachnospiraceae bacterium]
MFLTVFVNRFKIVLRSVDAILWSLAFALALGTLFYFAFKSIYKNAMNVTVDVAVVEGEEQYGSGNMSDLLKELTYEDGTKMLNIKKVDMKEAKKLLDAKEPKVSGIIDLREMSDIKLIVNETGVEASMLGGIVSILRQYSSIIVETIKSNPANVNSVIESFDNDVKGLVKSEPITGNNKDPYVTYFYNLIAMMAVMASMSGVSIPESCQANQSEVGKRVDCSPVNRVLYEIAGLLSAAIIKIAITIIGLCYFIFVLKIDFGGDLPYIFMTAILATLLGLSLGFFIGHIGSFSKKTRENILTTVVVAGGFLSGLMVANIKSLIEVKCPIINRINPSAVISDAFYTLNMYGVSDRFYHSIIYIVGLTIVFIVAGLIMSRRKSYASL